MAMRRENTVEVRILPHAIPIVTRDITRSRSPIGTRQNSRLCGTDVTTIPAKDRVGGSAMILETTLNVRPLPIRVEPIEDRPIQSALDAARLSEDPK